MYADDEDDHYENEKHIIEISLVNRVRCNTHVLIFMLAITNTSKLPLYRNFVGQEVAKTEKVIKTRFCTIFNRLHNPWRASLIKDEMKKLDYQTWFEKEQMVDDTDVQMFQRSAFITNPAIIYCSKLTIETLEKGVKYVQS